MLNNEHAFWFFFASKYWDPEPQKPHINVRHRRRIPCWKTKMRKSLMPGVTHGVTNWISNRIPSKEGLWPTKYIKILKETSIWWKVPWPCCNCTQNPHINPELIGGKLWKFKTFSRDFCDRLTLSLALSLEQCHSLASSTTEWMKIIYPTKEHCFSSESTACLKAKRALSQTHFARGEWCLQIDLQAKSKTWWTQIAITQQRHMTLLLWNFGSAVSARPEVWQTCAACSWPGL